MKFMIVSAEIGRFSSEIRDFSGEKCRFECLLRT